VLSISKPGGAPVLTLVIGRFERWVEKGVGGINGGGGEERRKGFGYSWQVCDWASQYPNPRLLPPSLVTQ